jgi:hypothetical protein
MVHGCGLVRTVPAKPVEGPQRSGFDKLKPSDQ